MKLYFKIVKGGLVGVILFALIGGIIPNLISSASHEGLFIGVLLLILLIPGAFIYVKKNIDSLITRFSRWM